MSGICKWRGCNEPSIVGKRGHMTDYCAQHLPAMQEKWRGKDKLKRAHGEEKPIAEPAPATIPGTNIPKPPVVPYTPVRVLQICKHCGRGGWLPKGETLVCNCIAQPATQPPGDEKLLALVNPADNTIGLYAGRLEHTGMTSWSNDDPRSGYATVALRLAEGGYALATLVTPHLVTED